MEDMLACGAAGHFTKMIDGLDSEKEKISDLGLRVLGVEGTWDAGSFVED